MSEHTTQTQQRLRVAVIRPSMLGEPASDKMTPLFFAIVKPLTPDWVDLTFWDEREARLPEQIAADVAAITVETFAAARAYRLAQRFKAEGKLVLLGGFHPTAMPDEADGQCDSVLVGDVEDLWRTVLTDIRENQLQKRYVSSGNFPVEQIRYDYSVFQGKKYLPAALIQFGRGCKFSCDFCSIHGFYGHSIRQRPVDLVINDIRQRKEKYVFFVDDNLFSQEQTARELFEALLPLKKKWVCQISMDVAKQPDLLWLMKESGCVMAIVGFESLNPTNLKQMGKGANLGELAGEPYQQVIENLHQAGIMIYGTFVIGYDEDTVETASLLMEFALRHKFAIANFNPLMPMPATPLYDRLKREGRLPYETWWLDPGYRYGNAMVTPKNMTEEELLESCKNARFQFNSPRNIWKRFTNRKANSRSLANAVLFLAAAMVSRKEIHNKQGKPLGGSR